MTIPRPLLTALALAATSTALLAQSPPAPLAYWTFDDNANPTSDVTGNGNDGALFGPPVFDVMDVAGAIGGGSSLAFDGTTNYVALNMSYSSAETIPALTVSVWFKTTFAGPPTGFGGNWSFLDFDRSEFFNVFVQPDGRIGFGSTSVSTLNDMASVATGLNDGSWHHAAVVYDGADKRIYVDGVLDSVVTNAHLGEPLGRGLVDRWAFIGDGSEAATYNGNRNQIYYDGKLDEIAFWGAALSDAQIAAIAAGGAVLDPDTDDDGLTDSEEAALGTGPNNPDSDNDGLQDGTEVNVTETNPLDADTDNDTLLDGAEVDGGTDPKKADTDDDGVNDALDSLPLEPGVTSGQLETELRMLCDIVHGYALVTFDARNDNARKGRRNATCNKLRAAANAVADGDYQDASDVLTSLLEKLDGANSPKDWMAPSMQRDALRDAIVLQVALIGYF